MMRIDLAIATTLAAAVLAYLLAGLLTQLFGGVVSWTDSPLLLAVTGAIAVGCFGVALFVLRAILSKNALTRTAIRPRVILPVLASVCAFVALTGIYFSYDRVAEHKRILAGQEAAKAAAAASSQAEAARVAALTPEQRATEEFERQRAAADAKSKRDAAAKAKKDADIAAQKAKDEQVTRRAVAALGAKTLREGMKDSDSFELRSAILMGDGSVCYDYRAQNSFGAHLRSSAILYTENAKVALLVEERDGNRFVTAWNKRCTKAGGEELAGVITPLIRR